MECEYPLLEFDASPQAVLEPSRLIKPRDVPQNCVLCFFQEVIAGLLQAGRTHQVATLRSEIGQHPLYEMDLDGHRLAVFHPGIGAPLAAAWMEELIALGCRKFVVCGGAGVLEREIAVGHVVVPVAAIRDEGTSYHYLPPGREVAPAERAVAAVLAVLQRHKVPYVTGKTWTTDAIYRETPGKVQQRRAEGCLTVEMEAAALFAVAQFRGIECAQLLYGGDDVSGSEWDSRDWLARAPAREQLFWLAAEACVSLE